MSSNGDALLSFPRKREPSDPNISAKAHRALTGLSAKRAKNPGRIFLAGMIYRIPAFTGMTCRGVNKMDVDLREILCLPTMMPCCRSRASGNPVDRSVWEVRVEHQPARLASAPNNSRKNFLSQDNLLDTCFRRYDMQSKKTEGCSNCVETTLKLNIYTYLLSFPRKREIQYTVLSGKYASNINRPVWQVHQTIPGINFLAGITYWIPAFAGMT